MNRIFWLVLQQTVNVAFRKGGGAFGTLAFYIIIFTLLTFALGPEEITLRAGAVFCIALLLANITALPLLFERDHEDGTIEQFLLQPVLLELLVLAKICGQWVASVAPLLVVSPLLAVMANLSFDQAMRPLFMLLLASPTVVALGSIAAALTLGSRRGGLLQALVVMPLYIPVLIFASTLEGEGAYYMLAGMLCATVPLSCYISAALIRVSQD
jgi:heme exporter protein B